MIFADDGEGDAKLTLIHRGCLVTKSGAEGRDMYEGGSVGVPGAYRASLAEPALNARPHSSAMSRVSPGSVNTSPPNSARAASPLPKALAGT